MKDREDDGEGKENAENESDLSSSQTSIKKEEKQKRGMLALPRIFWLDDRVSMLKLHIFFILLKGVFIQ